MKFKAISEIDRTSNSKPYVCLCRFLFNQTVNGTWKKLISVPVSGKFGLPKLQ